MTVSEVFVFLVLGETPENVAPATVLALLSLGLLPFAVVALVIGVFAERWRGWCLGVSLVYFVGWGVLFLAE